MCVSHSISRFEVFRFSTGNRHQRIIAKSVGYGLKTFKTTWRIMNEVKDTKSDWHRVRITRLCFVNKQSVLEIAGQRREAEKEATKAAKVLMTVHDIESKALASFAGDLREMEKVESVRKSNEPQVGKQTTSLDTQARKITVEVPKHPHQAIGGYSIPDIRKLGVQKGGITKKKTSTSKVRCRVESSAEVDCNCSVLESR